MDDRRREASRESAEILADAATMEAIQAGLEEIERGEVVEFDDLRSELAERRAARANATRTVRPQ